MTAPWVLITLAFATWLATGVGLFRLERAGVYGRKRTRARRIASAGLTLATVLAVAAVAWELTAS